MDVERIINAWDPMGLLPYAPDDEYSFEIEAVRTLIQRGIRGDALAEQIYDVFCGSFGNAFTRSIHECRGIADRLEESER